jgi:hypothetical protein
MKEVQHWNFALILLAITLLVGWNYWVPLFFFSTPFALFGGGSGDFHLFYLAGKAWQLGNNPYLPYVLIRGSPVRFIYPPTSLPFFGAYALYNFRYASQLWVITYYALFLAALTAVAYAFKGPRRVLFISLSLVLFFTSYPLLILMQLGQSDLLVSSLAMLAFAALKLKHQFTSASLLALSVLVKGPPSALLLIYFVFYSKNLKYFVQFLITSVGLTLVSLLVVPPGWFASYLHLIINGSRAFNAVSNQSIVSLLPRLNLGWLSGIVSVAGYVGFAIFAWKYARPRVPKEVQAVLDNGMLLLNILVLLLFDPRATIYPYVWVILPLGIFLSGLVLANVRLSYLALLGVGAFLLNATVAPESLNYQILPLNLIGNVLTTVLLFVAFLKTGIVFPRLHVTDADRQTRLPRRRRVP